MRLIVISLVVLLAGAYAGEEKISALKERVGELKAKLVEVEKAIEHADNEEAKARAKAHAQELRGAIERGVQELNEFRAKAAAEKPARGPAAREGGGLERIVDRIAELRKQAIIAKREGRLDQARELWLESEKLDATLKRELGEGAPAPKPDVPPGEVVERAFGEAKQALEQKRVEAAGQAFKQATQALERIVNGPRMGPEDANWCRERIQRLMGGADVLAERGHADMAERLRGSAKELMAAFERQQGRPGPDARPGADLERRMAELTKEREKVEARIGELERARGELDREVDRREAAVREAEGEKREALKRELMAVVEKLKAVGAELDELRAHAAKLDQQRARVEGAMREGGERPRREGDRPVNPELMEKLRNVEREAAENAQIVAKLRAEISEIEKKASMVDGERREGMQRELRELRDKLAVHQRNVQELRGRRAELQKAAGVEPRPDAPARRVERDRPQDPRAEIEALRAEVRELRRLLQEALKK